MRRGSGGRRMNSVTRRMVRGLTAGILLVVLQPAAISIAGNVGSAGTPGTGDPFVQNGVWLTPNSTWAIAEVNLTAGMSSALFSALGDYVNQDLHVQNGQATPVSSCTGSSGWDLCAFDLNYGDNGLVGVNQCAGFVNGAHPNQTCTMDWVKYNNFYVDGYVASKKQFVACHEIAHGWGLRHPRPINQDSGSCIRDDGVVKVHLSTHSLNHLNTLY